MAKETPRGCFAEAQEEVEFRRLEVGSQEDHDSHLMTQLPKDSCPKKDPKDPLAKEPLKEGGEKLKMEEADKAPEKKGGREEENPLLNLQEQQLSRWLEVGGRQSSDNDSDSDNSNYYFAWDLPTWQVQRWRQDVTRVFLRESHPWESLHVADAFRCALRRLSCGERRRFRRKLREIPLKEGFVHIPEEALQEADVWRLEDLLLSYYGGIYTFEVAAEALKTVAREYEAERLLVFAREEDYSTMPPYIQREGRKKKVWSLEGVTVTGYEMFCKGRQKLLEIIEKDLEFFLRVSCYGFIITRKEYWDLWKAEESSKEKSEKLLNMIQERGEVACCWFLEQVERKHPYQVILPEEGIRTKMENPACSGTRVVGNLCHSEGVPEKIKPEVVWDSERGNKAYRVHATEAGSFYCSDTDLICEVKEAVVVTYHFDSWAKHLEEHTTKEWDVAGPLLNLKADALKAVAAIHVPHFLCLEGEDSSHVYIAHFVEGGMRLEKPDRVEPHHAVLENPTFSSLGVIFKKWFKQKINTVVLLYHRLKLETPTFHLYLLPNDPSIIQAVDKHEVNSRRIEKPPVTLKPLTIGSQVSLNTPEDVTVCPKELKFQYLDAEKLQQYLELSAEQMQDKFSFYLMKKGTNEVVWEAHLKRRELISGELASSILHPAQGPQLRNSSTVHFIEQHREALIQRTTPVEPVLDRLYGSVLSEEQYQRITAKKTNPGKMRELYRLVPSWDLRCKNMLHEALKDKNPDLVNDLEGQCGPKRRQKARRFQGTRNPPPNC